jgi:hypothetical protein
LSEEIRHVQINDGIAVPDDEIVGRDLAKTFQQVGACTALRRMYEQKVGPRQYTTKMLTDHFGMVVDGNNHWS